MHRGAMLAVGLSEELIRPYLKEVELSLGSVSLVVACINSPKNVTVSGDEAHIDFIKSLIDRESIFARKLQVNVAYHSPQMNHIAAAYSASMGKLEAGHLGNARMISSVTGMEISPAELQMPEYWVKNLTSPVKFFDALQRMCTSGSDRLKNKLGYGRATVAVTDLLEIGPHSALQSSVKETLHHLVADISYTSVQTRSAPAVDALLTAVGRIHCFGYSINLSKLSDGSKEKRVLTDLPEYPFNHSRSYWHESRLNKEGLRLRKHPRLDLLGYPVLDWNPLEAKWRNVLRTSDIPWIRDHTVRFCLLAAWMISAV